MSFLAYALRFAFRYEAILVVFAGGALPRGRRR